MLACICLSTSLRPNSHWPPWPRTCPSVTLCLCPRRLLSMATTRSGWCRRTFLWLLPSDRVNRPSTSTQDIPVTDKVGCNATLHTPNRQFHHCLPSACSHEAESHIFTITTRSVWLHWWPVTVLCDISCTFCNSPSEHIQYLALQLLCKICSV